SAHCLATPVDKVPPFRNAPSPPQIYTLSLHDALPITTPAAYIADITLVPHISGRVKYRVETVGDGAVTVEILDPAGRPVAKAEGAAGSVDVPHPQLWEPWPGTPHLYTARVAFGEDCY